MIAFERQTAPPHDEVDLVTFRSSDRVQEASSRGSDPLCFAPFAVHFAPPGPGLASDPRRAPVGLSYNQSNMIDSAASSLLALSRFAEAVSAS